MGEQTQVALGRCLRAGGWGSPGGSGHLVVLDVPGVLVSLFLWFLFF
jgi:hypothetical protein